MANKKLKHYSSITFLSYIHNRNTFQYTLLRLIYLWESKLCGVTRHSLPVCRVCLCSFTRKLKVFMPLTHLVRLEDSGFYKYVRKGKIKTPVLTMDLDKGVSVQYKTTVVDDSTMALSPTGGMRGACASAAGSSRVQTDTYEGGPSPISLKARTAITYSEFTSISKGSKHCREQKNSNSLHQKPYDP